MGVVLKASGVLVILLLMIGCSINPKGFHEFWQYQAGKLAYKEGKEQIKSELEEGFLQPEEYHERREQIRLRYKSREFFTLGRLKIDSKGRIRYNSSLGQKAKSYGSTIDSFGVSTSLDRIRIRASMGHFRIDFKQNYDGEWSLLAAFVFRY